MHEARLYIICGMPFAGKSTLVRALIRQRGGRAIDIDAINTARGVGIAGAPIMAAEWTENLATARAALVATLAVGETVAYDGHPFGRAQGDEVRALARHDGVRAVLLVVSVPEEVARVRLLANRRDPQRHDVPDGLFEQALALFEPPTAAEGPLCYDGATPLATWVAALP